MTRFALVAAMVMMSSSVLAAERVSSERVDPAGASETDLLRGNVLVWADATFYTEPADDAATVHAASLPGARKDAVGNVVPMHVVSVVKGFVEVEPADELDCTWSRLQTNDDIARLHLFVKRADLAPVVSQPFQKTFDNGSAIALRPGVPVIARTDGQYQLGLRGEDLAAELPATAVGYAYTPDKIKAAPTMLDREFELLPKTPAALGSRTFVLRAQHATSTELRGNSMLFSIKTRCIAVDLLVSANRVHPIDSDESELDVSSGLGVLDLRDQDYIAAGTPLATPGGRTIAAAARPIYLMSAPRGKTACIDRRVRVGVVGGDALEPKDGDDKLKLCAPSGRVIHERMRSASSANGTTHR